MARRLSAIFAADIVGYSRLIGCAEEDTVKRLNCLYRELVGPEIEKRNGRTVKLMGDGLLAEFSSVVEAVHCAISIQTAIPVREAEVPEDLRFRLRIGINLGDIIVTGNDIHGDGVNVAARLESLSEPDGLCISQSVHEQVRDRMEVEFEDIGLQQVKNIERPIRVYQWRFSDTVTSRVENTGADTDTLSIAVLPFQNMSAEPAHEFLAEGISEEITTALSKIPDFLVLSQHSTMKYKTRPLDIQRVAAEQGARYILAGSLRASGNRIRVSAQLIEAKTGLQTWAERYDRHLEDVFELQDEISLKIATSMLGEIGEGEMARLRGGGTRDLQAWSLHVNATALMRQVSKESYAQARGLINQALVLDPGYSAANSTLALTHAMDARHGFSDSRAASVALARQAALCAIELNSQNAEAYGVLGFADSLDGKLKEAIDKFETALKINPNHAEVCIRLALTLIFDGQPEKAVKLAERGKRLCPRYPPWYSGLHGFALRAAGQYQESIQYFEEYGRLVEGFGHIDLAIVYVMLDDLEHARTEADEILRHHPDFTVGKWAQTQLYGDRDGVQRDVDALLRVGLPA